MIKGAVSPLLQRKAKIAGFVRVKKRRFWGELITAFQYIKGTYKKR